MPQPENTAQPSAARDRGSQQVTDTSHALDLQEGVFTLTSPRDIALSLKHSADTSTRRKTEPFRSAMSMLTFYINRAGRQLSTEQRDRLEQAKDELRALYGRPGKHPQNVNHNSPQFPGGV